MATVVPRAALALLIGAASAACAPRPEPTPWPGLAFGESAVGYVSARLEDPSRPLDGRPRPVQVACWHPARPTTGAAPLSYRDYFAESAAERAEATPAAVDGAIAAYAHLFKENGVDPALVERWLATPVKARRNQTPDVGDAPLIVIAQGNGHSIHHQAVLAEYLASYGYLVCTTPSQSRLSPPMSSERDVLPHARDQQRDLQLAITYARERFPRASSRAPRLGIVGHSFGARSGLLLAAATHASALVSLDGGITSSQARNWLADAADFDPEEVTTPIFHLYQAGTPESDRDFTLVGRLRKSPRLLGRFDGLRHTDFTSLGFASAAFPGLTGPAPDALGDKCAALALYTRMFLDAHLRDTPEAQELLAKPSPYPWLTLER